MTSISEVKITRDMLNSSSCEGLKFRESSGKKCCLISLAELQENETCYKVACCMYVIKKLSLQQEALTNFELKCPQCRTALKIEDLMSYLNLEERLIFISEKIVNLEEVLENLKYTRIAVSFSHSLIVPGALEKLRATHKAIDKKIDQYSSESDKFRFLIPKIQEEAARLGSILPTLEDDEKRIEQNKEKCDETIKRFLSNLHQSVEDMIKANRGFVENEQPNTSSYSAIPERFLLSMKKMLFLIFFS